MYYDIAEERDTVVIGCLVIKWPSLIHQPLNMKRLHFFETLGYIKFPATQCNIPEDQNSKYSSCGDSRPRDSSFVRRHEKCDACCAVHLNVISSLCPDKGKLN
jgi:hypothetical protein